MTIGGTETGDMLEHTCDVPGPYLLDLSTFEWLNTYSPEGKIYEVPEAIQKSVGGEYVLRVDP